MQDNEKPCWLYVDGQVSSYSDALSKMQSKIIKDKESALITCLYSMISDETYPDNLMIQTIKFVNPCDDLEIKKLLMIFWEVIEKKDKANPDQLRSEFLLVCNSIRKDLTSPNEFIRGRILKLVSKLPYPDLFESIRSVIFENINHKNSYVRRNALSCVISLINFFGTDSLPADLVDTLKDLIDKESDLCTKRNAFTVLSMVDSEESLKLTKDILINNEISEISELLLLAIIKNLKSIFKSSDNQANKVKIVKLLMELINHKSTAVQFEVATTLMSIISNPTIIRQVITVLSNLLLELNDTNLLIVILNKLSALRKKFKSLLEENVLTYCAILTKNPTNRVRNLLFDMINDLITESNINPVFDILIKHYNQSRNPNEALSLEFKFNILNSIYTNIKLFPSVDKSYVLFTLQKVLLLEDVKKQYLEERTSIIKDIFEIYSIRQNRALINDLISKIIQHFDEIVEYKVFAVALFVFSEYTGYINDSFLFREIYDTVLKNIGELNFELKESIDVTKKSQAQTETNKKTVTKTVIMEDGTYGTTTTVVSSEKNKEKKLFLREALLNSNYFFASSLAVCLTKLLFNIIKSSDNSDVKVDHINKYLFNTINILCALIKMDSHKVFKDSNNLNRINMCLECILENKHDDFLNWINESKEFINKANSTKPTEDLSKNQKVLPGEYISFRHATPYDQDALGLVDNNENDSVDKLDLDKLLLDNSADKKKFIVTLTGMEDLLQVEACIEIFTYDIIVEFSIKNKSKQDLQNITIELYAPTNLEIIEKAPSVILGSGESTKVKSCIKFSNSCNSFIFGEISYSNYRGTVASINLSGIFINLFNSYAASCSEANFRKCWMNYNWEHKTPIISKMKTFTELIETLCSHLNLRLVFPNDFTGIDEESSFLVSNLYTKSKLGEDALINISIEKCKDKKIIGTAMIRSKVKEFAVFIGDKIKLIIK